MFCGTEMYMSGVTGRFQYRVVADKRSVEMHWPSTFGLSSLANRNTSNSLCDGALMKTFSTGTGDDLEGWHDGRVLTGFKGLRMQRIRGRRNC